MSQHSDTPLEDPALPPGRCGGEFGPELGEVLLVCLLQQLIGIDETAVWV